MAIISNAVTADFFSRNRQLVGRFQDRRIRQTFPFVRLPAELRNEIYDLCLSFNGVKNFFDNYYVRLKHTRNSAAVYPPKHARRTPTILLLCRQIYAEAIGLLKKKAVVFNHGLLDIKGIDEVISEHALRRLGAIEINVSGHSMLQRNIEYISWTGYMDLLSSLGRILSEGHSLRKLLIDLSDADLALHATTCWHSTNNCDYRDHLKQAFDYLRKVRGVGSFEILGIDANLARELKARIESKPISFLDLPGELRNNICTYAADYSEVSVKLGETVRAWVDHSKDPPYPARSTPTILLLNKQINKEATEIIRKRPLKLVLPLDHNLQRQAQVPNLLKFITAKTLQNLQHLSINVASWEWIFSLEGILPVLAEKHNLKSFHLTVKDSLKSTFLAAQTKQYPDYTLRLTLSKLKSIRGVKDVIIDGDLPESYAKPLAAIMQAPAGITNLPKLQAVCGNGAVVDEDGENN